MTRGEDGLWDVVAFLADEVAPAVCRAAGELAGAALVAYRPLERERPLVCKCYMELAVAARWLRHRAKQLDNAVTAAAGGDAELARAAGRVCFATRRAAVAWAERGEADGGVPRDDEWSETVWGCVREACGAAAEVLADPSWQLRLRLVATGVAPGDAVRAATASLSA